MNSLLSFELYFSYKQRALLILSVIALTYGFLIHFQDIGEGMQHIAVNSSYRITYFLTLTSVLLSFAAALFCINSLLKDKDHQFEEIIYSSKSKHLISRRIYCVLLNTLLVSCFLLVGLLVASVTINFGGADIDSQRVLPFMLLRTLWPWLIIVIPNILFITSVLIGITLKWKSGKITYASSVILLLWFVASMLLINAPITGPSMLTPSWIVSLCAIADPFASSAFFVQTQFWQTTEKNLLFIALDNHLLFNRLLVVMVSLILFKQSMTRKLSMTRLGSVEKSTPIKPSTAKQKTKPQNIEILTKTWRDVVKHFLMIFSFECRILIKGWPLRILLTLWVVMVVIGVGMVAGVFTAHEFSGKYPTTAYLIDQAAESFSLFCPAIMVLVVADKIWQERDYKFEQLYASTQISRTTSLITKMFATSLIPLIMISLLLVVCIGYQMAFKDNQNLATQIRWSHYVSLYYYLGFPQILNLVLIFVVQTTVSQYTMANKYLAMLVSILVLVVCATFLSKWGLIDPMLQINQFPDLTRRYSELTGFDQVAVKFHWLALYWAALAMILLAITLKIWHKRERIHNSPKMVVRNISMIIFPLLTMAFIALYTQVNKPLKHDALNTSDQLQSLAEYEIQYSNFNKLLIPQYSATKVEMDFYPQAQQVNIRSSNTLINNSKTDINQIFITSKKKLNDIRIKGAKLTMQNNTAYWNVYLFDLEKPLKPHQKTKLKYALEIRSTAFSIDNSITNNASYFHQGHFEPLLGYAKFMELEGDYQRQQFDLPANKKIIETDFTKHIGYGKFVQQKRQFEAILSTHKSQSAVTSGELIGSWTENQRAFYHYKMDRTIYPVAGYFSANYESKKFKVNGLDVEISATSTHQTNINEIAQATKTTIEFMERHYGKYPYPSLRLIEVPRHNPFGGKASAGVVALNESLFLQNHLDGASINNVARNTIHEIVHQWFGEKMVPKISYGEQILTESITKEIEATILGLMYGQTMSESIMDFNKRRYMSGRSFTHSPEPSLLHSIDERYLSYGKGPIVFQQVKKHLGDKKYHHVLKGFIEKHQNGMTATLTDLVEQFMKESKDPKMIHRLFNEA